MKEEITRLTNPPPFCLSKSSENNLQILHAYACINYYPQHSSLIDTCKMQLLLSSCHLNGSQRLRHDVRNHILSVDIGDFQLIFCNNVSKILIPDFDMFGIFGQPQFLTDNYCTRVIIHDSGYANWNLHVDKEIF